MQKASVYSSFIASQMPEVKQGELDPDEMKEEEGTPTTKGKKRGRGKGGKDAKKSKGMLNGSTII